MTNYKDIYIGRLIQQKVDEQHISYSEFARQIHCSRTNIYRIFECKSIDIERLILISDVLHYDFIHEVYLPQHNTPDMESVPSVSIPIRNGRICTDELPEPLRKLIAESL